MPKYIAHINEKSGKIQTVEEHSVNTANLCQALSVGQLKDIAFLIGIMHDVGKYSEIFQRRINGENVKYEHSVIGAKLIDRLMPQCPASLLLRLCIAGHHTGIPNCGNKTDTADDTSLYGRLKRDDKDFDYDFALKENHLTDLNFDFNKINADFVKFISSMCKSKEDAVEAFAFFTRYCFSCLVDADTIDTIKASGGDENRSLTADFEECLRRVQKKLTELQEKSLSKLQKARGEIQKQAYSRIDKEAKVYLLNMPTGSGKTLAGLQCALHRAIKTNKKRLIYVIPYNSIINQTAQTFERLLDGCAEILRHQSSFSYDIPDAENDIKAFIYATENWDAQIIITTAVQFFESVYSNKRSKLRKFHNMGDSVIVFDEAHLMPINYLQPCLRAVGYIVNNLNSEAVFMTATMPDFKELMRDYAGNIGTVDLIEDKSLFSAFKKCDYENLSVITNEELIHRAMSFPSALIVVNNRKTARELYSLCQGKKYHLSTYMTSFDRERVIDEIQAGLKELEKIYPTYVPPDERIVVISTSLIEAGVDLDFHMVFREMSGLDNILQAGGRCNREGKRERGKVYIFSREESSVRGDLGIRINITKGIIKNHDDISSHEAVREYYEYFYRAMKDAIVQNSLSNICGCNLQTIPFADYSVNIIDSKTVSVVVDENEESSELIGRLKAGFPNIRKLRKYCCTVYENERNELIEQGVIENYDNGICVLTNSDYYDENIGIKFEASDYIL